MYKLFIALLFVTFTACNSKSPTSKNSSSDNAAKGSGTSAWTREDEMEFMDACVEGSSERLGEEKAFNQCKCILRQIQAENPGNDSTKSALIMTDTAKMAAMAQKCKD